ncbi:C6 transcription factor [Colletotrichum scovillei]|uniref:C6 transcription factor n=1 Tax=Colletotrichum scovillei TaxID=1209932 RepID=UPI0015C2F80A|nr:C6 transcription factor [Colletotrichum scovillei]KAF4782084.1 C6 transcription factor [Colletotrichum scovillei]
MSKPLPSRPSEDDNENSPLLPRDASPSSPHDEANASADPNPSTLLLFRRAVGINTHLQPADDCDLEAGRTSALGIYASTIAAHRRFRTLRILATVLIYSCHATQIVVGGVLTCLGPKAGVHRTSITVLGGVNTVVAGVLTWMKGQGMPDKLKNKEIDFRKLQNWIEETEALMVLGTVGGTREEVGGLVEAAYRRWNAANERGEDGGPGEEYEDEGRKGKGSTMRWLRGR